MARKNVPNRQEAVVKSFSQSATILAMDLLMKIFILHAFMKIVLPKMSRKLLDKMQILIVLYVIFKALEKNQLSSWNANTYSILIV